MPPLDCKRIHSYMGAFLLAQVCRQDADGGLQLTTPFRYPDGECVVLSVKIAVQGDYTLSDDGRTLEYLEAQAAVPDETVTQAICQPFSVVCIEGALCLSLPIQQAVRGGLPDAVIDLAQACVRLANLRPLLQPPVAGPDACSA